MPPKLGAVFISWPVDCVDDREDFMNLGYWLFALAALVIVIGLIAWQFKR